MTICGTFEATAVEFNADRRRSAGWSDPPD
jgi:hypothetical protein